MKTLVSQKSDWSSWAVGSNPARVCSIGRMMVPVRLPTIRVELLAESIL
jgi:hypothetical protein